MALISQNNNGLDSLVSIGLAVDEAFIAAKLSAGWELANRGKGWWLTAPRADYKRSEQFPVDDLIVDRMKTKGVITLELPYTTMFARLISAADA